MLGKSFSGWSGYKPSGGGKTLANKSTGKTKVLSRPSTKTYSKQSSKPVTNRGPGKVSSFDNAWHPASWYAPKPAKKVAPPPKVSDVKAVPTKPSTTSKVLPGGSYNPLSGGSANPGAKAIAAKKIANAAIGARATQAGVAKKNAYAGAVKVANAAKAARAAQAVGTAARGARILAGAAKKVAARPTTPTSRPTTPTSRPTGGGGGGSRPTTPTTPTRPTTPTTPTNRPPTTPPTTPTTPTTNRPGSTSAGRFTKRGGRNMTAGQFRRRRQSRGPLTGQSITPEMLRAISRQRIVNYG